MFLAAVTDPSTSAVVSGSVQFLDGMTVLATVRLDASGRASFTTSTLARGGHTITAAFVANASFAGSASNGVNLSVV
jgi:hypothetical protein